MNVTPVFLNQFHNQAERILHRKGNFTGPPLEMTIVLDHNLCAEKLCDCVPALLRCLKQRSEIFRNVRLNVTDWIGDSRIENGVRPMLSVITGGCFRDDRTAVQEKRIELLYQYLKFYHARSKLIVLVTDGKYRVGDEKAQNEALKPFLERKLMRITVTEEGMELS